MTQNGVIEEKDSFNAKELSKILNVHPETIRRMIREGDIQAEREGREYRITKSEKERLANENKPTVETILSHLEFVIELYQNELAAAKPTFEKWDGLNTLYYMKQYELLQNTRNELQRMESNYRDLIRRKRVREEDPYDIKQPLEGYFSPPSG